MGCTFHSFSQILAHSALNSERITIFVLVTAQHENEAQSVSYSLWVYFGLFIRKKTSNTVTYIDIKPSVVQTIQAKVTSID